MANQLEIVKKYIEIVENLTFDQHTSEELIHRDYLQWELPNQLNKNGQKSDAQDSFKRIQTAKLILASQKYQVTSMIESQNTVVVETLWTGQMAIDAGPLKKGQLMKAYICMFYEFKEGKIHRVRNYDCFEPLTS